MTVTRVQLGAVFLLIAIALTVAVVWGRHHDGLNNLLRPCPTEDSTNCVWRSHHGGLNFVNVGGTQYQLLP